MSSTTTSVISVSDREDLEIERLERKLKQLKDRKRKRLRSEEIQSPPRLAPAHRLPVAPPPPALSIVIDSESDPESEESETETESEIVCSSRFTVYKYVSTFLTPNSERLSRDESVRVGRIASILYRARYSPFKSLAALNDRNARLTKPFHKIEGASGFPTNAYDDSDTHLIEKAYFLATDMDLDAFGVLRYLKHQGWAFIRQIVDPSCPQDVFETLVSSPR